MSKKGSSLSKLSNTISSLIKKNKGFSKYSETNSRGSRNNSSSMIKERSPLSTENNLPKMRERQSSIKSSSSSYLKKGRLSIGNKTKAIKLRNTSQNSTNSNKSSKSNVSASSNNLFAKNLLGKAVRKGSTYSGMQKAAANRQLTLKNQEIKLPRQLSKKASDFLGGRPSFKKDIQVLKNRIDPSAVDQINNQKVSDAKLEKQQIKTKIINSEFQNKIELYGTPDISKIKNPITLDDKRSKGIRATLEELRILKSKISSSSKNQASKLTSHKCDCQEELNRLREENSELRDVLYVLLEQFNQKGPTVYFLKINYRCLLIRKLYLRKLYSVHRRIVLLSPPIKLAK